MASRVDSGMVVDVGKYTRREDIGRMGRINFTVLTFWMLVVRGTDVGRWS